MAPHTNESVLNDTPDAADDAAMVTISIGKLLSQDKETEEKLLRACTDLGFFYLDCCDHPSRQLTSQIDSVAVVEL